MDRCDSVTCSVGWGVDRCGVKCSVNRCGVKCSVDRCGVKCSVRMGTGTGDQNVWCGTHQKRGENQEESRTEGWVGPGVLCRDWEVGATPWVLLGCVYVFGEV